MTRAIKRGQKKNILAPPEANPQTKSDPPNSPPKWRNRIVRTATLDANDVKLNPKNWRRHPDSQGQAMDAILDEVGWVQDVVINETTGHVIDGELRILRARPRGEPVPVKFVALSVEEEEKILAVFDPISQLAVTDVAALDALKDFPTDNLFLRDLVDQHLAAGSEDSEEDEENEKSSGDIPASLALQPFENYDYIVLLFRNTLDFSKACDQFGIAQAKSPIGDGRYKIGVGRVVDGKRVLELISCKS